MTLIKYVYPSLALSLKFIVIVLLKGFKSQLDFRN